MSDSFVPRFKAALLELEASTPRLRTLYEGSTHSRDLQEAGGTERRRLLIQAGSRCFQLLNLVYECAADVTKVFDAPPTPTAAAVPLRTAIAVSGRISWMIDPDVTSAERVRRAYATVKRDVDEEISFSEMGGAYDGPRKELVEYGRRWAREQKADFARRASGLGIGSAKFEGDEAAADRQGMRFEYELGSNIAHGGRGGLAVVEHRMRGNDIFRGEYVGLLLAAAADSYGRAIWSLACHRTNQGVLDDLRTRLDAIYDVLTSPADARSYYLA